MLDFIKKYKFEILLIMFTLLIMLIYDENGFLYNFTNYPDVKIYYNIGKRLIFGKQLYIDLIDVKGPYMFFIGALSYLLNKDMTMFFIIDCVFMLIYSIYTYKIFKLYVNELTSFISTICINMLIFPKFEYFGNFEVMLIGINTIFIHWILNDGFKKKNNKLFFVFGIFISLILLIKLNYLFSFGIIGLIYLFTSIKNKKKIKKELLSMFGGFLVGCTPLFIYDIIHKSYFLTIIRYIFFCFNYGSNKFMINLSLYQLLKLFILFVFIVFSFFIINILNNKNIKLVFLFF